MMARVPTNLLRRIRSHAVAVDYLAVLSDRLPRGPIRAVGLAFSFSLTVTLGFAVTGFALVVIWRRGRDLSRRSHGHHIIHLRIRGRHRYAKIARIGQFLLGHGVVFAVLIEARAVAGIRRHRSFLIHDAVADFIHILMIVAMEERRQMAIH